MGIFCTFRPHFKGQTDCHCSLPRQLTLEWHPLVGLLNLLLEDRFPLPCCRWFFAANPCLVVVVSPFVGKRPLSVFLPDATTTVQTSLETCFQDINIYFSQSGTVQCALCVFYWSHEFDTTIHVYNLLQQAHVVINGTYM